MFPSIQWRAEDNEEKAGRKWVSSRAPCLPTNSGITNQHANAYFLPCSILFPGSAHVAAPRRPLSLIQGCCILCFSGTAREKRLLCCESSEFSAGRGVSQQINDQPWPSTHVDSRQGPHGTGHLCIYVSMYLCMYTHKSWAVLVPTDRLYQQPLPPPQTTIHGDSRSPCRSCHAT